VEFPLMRLGIDGRRKSAVGLGLTIAFRSGTSIVAIHEVV
jgi:hypothetical protein